MKHAGIRMAIAILAIALMFFLLWSDLHELLGMIQLKSLPLVFAAISLAVTFVAIAYSMHAAVIFQTGAARLSLGGALQIAIWRSYANLLAPLGGLGSSLILVQRAIGGAWRSAAGIVLLLFVSQVATSFFLTGALLLVLANTKPEPVVIFTGMACMSGGIMLGIAWMFRQYFYRLWPHYTLAGAKHSDTIDIPNSVKPGRGIALLLWQVAIFLLRGGRFFLVALGLGIEIDLVSATVIIALADLATMLNLTPGGIGVRELTALLFGTQFGFAAASLFSVAIVDRVIFSLLTALGAGLLISLGLTPPRQDHDK